MTDTRTRLLKGAVWIALGSMIANGIGFLNTIIMARLLVPEDFGLVAICAAVMAILLSLAEMPLSETLVRHDAPTEEHFNTVFSMSFGPWPIFSLHKSHWSSPSTSSRPKSLSYTLTFSSFPRGLSILNVNLCETA